MKFFRSMACIIFSVMAFSPALAQDNYNATNSYYIEKRQQNHDALRQDFYRAEQQRQNYLDENRALSAESDGKYLKWKQEQNTRREHFFKPYESPPTRLDHRTPAQRERALRKQKQNLKKQ